MSRPPAPAGRFVDSHCHLTMEAFAEDREEALERARRAGVSDLLVVSARAGDAESVLEFARGRERVWAAVGLHPHEARHYDDAVEASLRAALKDPVAIALGEIGLDYHYDHSPRETQREVFRRQIGLAREAGRRIVLHTRQARGDTIRILEEESAPSIGGVFHCFTEDAATAAWAVENGFFVSFSGVLTFRTAEALRAVARGVPIERTLIETDAPYLSPEPLRGRRNEPASVRRVAACLGELHGLAEGEIGRLTAGNFDRLFGTAAPAPGRD